MPFSRPTGKHFALCHSCHDDTRERASRLALDAEAGALLDQLGDMIATALALAGSERATKAARMVQEHMRRRRGKS